MTTTEYDSVRVHLTGSDVPVPAAPHGKRCVKSVIRTYTSTPGDSSGAQQILEQLRQGQERIAVILPHGPVGGGNPNTSYGWIGHAKREVEQGQAGSAGYVQGTGQGPIPYHGPEGLYFEADAGATQLSMTVYDYIFEH